MKELPSVYTHRETSERIRVMFVPGGKLDRTTIPWAEQGITARALMEQATQASYSVYAGKTINGTSQGEAPIPLAAVFGLSGNMAYTLRLYPGSKYYRQDLGPYHFLNQDGLLTCITKHHKLAPATLLVFARFGAIRIANTDQESVSPKNGVPMIDTLTILKHTLISGILRYTHEKDSRQTIKKDSWQNLVFSQMRHDMAKNLPIDMFQKMPGFLATKVVHRLVPDMFQLDYPLYFFNLEQLRVFAVNHDIEIPEIIRNMQDLSDWKNMFRQARKDPSIADSIVELGNKVKQFLVKSQTIHAHVNDLSAMLVPRLYVNTAHNMLKASKRHLTDKYYMS